MVLSNYWQISLSMAVHLTCFIGLCLLIASKLYKNRKQDKKKLKRHNKEEDAAQKKKKLPENVASQVNENLKLKGFHVRTTEECGDHWTNYKRDVNKLQVDVRQQVWLFQFVLTLLCMVIIYPTEFIYQIRETFIDLKEENVVSLLDYLIFYLFWGGVYHSPYPVSGHGYFYNFYGYLIILILLIFEKNGQQWALNRFGCTQEKVLHFQEVELQFAKLNPPKSPLAPKPAAGALKSAAVPETINEEEEESKSSRSESAGLSAEDKLRKEYNHVQNMLKLDDDRQYTLGLERRNQYLVWSVILHGRDDTPHQDGH